MKLNRFTIYALGGVVIILSFLASCQAILNGNKVGNVSVSQMYTGLTVPLVEAIVEGDYHEADSLLSQGADINQIGMEEETTPLIWVGAVTKRDLKKLEYMLINGASPNIRSKKGVSAMSLAASGDSKALLEYS